MLLSGPDEAEMLFSNDTVSMLPTIYPVSFDGLSKIVRK